MRTNIMFFGRWINLISKLGKHITFGTLSIILACFKQLNILLIIWISVGYFLTGSMSAISLH